MAELGVIEQEIEETLEAGRKAFARIGEKLKEIKEGRLYRDQYPSFDAYCEGRWSISGRHAARMIEGASVLALLGGTKAKVTERQLRPLSKLDPEDVPQAWEEAKRVSGSDSPPTSVVEKVVNEWHGTSDEVEKVDPVVEWERAEAELVELREIVDSFKEGTAEQELVKVKERYRKLEARNQQMSTTINELTSQVKYYQRALDKIGNLVNAKGAKEIVNAIQDIMR